jgi:hypothetical protein
MMESGVGERGKEDAKTLTKDPCGSKNWDL